MSAFATENKVGLFASLVPQSFFYDENTSPKVLSDMKKKYLLAKQDLLNGAKNAITAFVAKEFNQFDALVKDCACQIRALQVIRLATNREFITSLVETLQTLDATDVERGDVPLSEDQLRMIVAYLLTISREKTTRERNGRDDYKESGNSLKILPRISKNKADGVLKRMIKLLAKDSTNFVRDEADRLGLYVGEEKLIGPFKIPQLSFYRMTKVVFLSAAEQSIPVLVKIRKVESAFDQFKTFALFETNGLGEYAFSVLTNEKIESQEPCLVIEGFTSSSRKVALEAIKEIGLMRMIDLNAAQHTQFTDKSDPVDEDLDLSMDATEAVSRGFSDSNFSVYCIDHIFCDVLGNQKKGIN